MDGGARRHLFITEVPDEAMFPSVTRRLYSLVHGDLTVGDTEVENGVLEIAGRTADLFVDQSMKDSIRLQHELASSCPRGKDCQPSGRLFEVRYAAAAEAAGRCAPKLTECDGSKGPTSGDMFCNAFMVCLAHEGRLDGMRAGANDAWLSVDDLCLGSDPSCAKKGATTRKLF